MALLRWAVRYKQKLVTSVPLGFANERFSLVHGNAVLLFGRLGTFAASCSAVTVPFIDCILLWPGVGTSRSSALGTSPSPHPIPWISTSYQLAQCGKPQAVRNPRQTALIRARTRP